MTSIVSVHSFRGGTGKSNTTANVAAVLAGRGLRVGVVDLDILSPGIHVLFGVDRPEHHLDGFLWGRYPLREAAREVTPPGTAGRIWLVPSSVDPHDIARIMAEGYDVGLLGEGVRALAAELELDVLLLDTHPGLNEETLLSIAMSDALAIVLRPDHQDYEGTHVTVSVARKLAVPRTVLVVNKCPEAFEPADVALRVSEAYGTPVAAVVPHSEELMVLSSGGIFVLHHPDHPVAALYGQLADQLVGTGVRA
ncbi:MinD/ParA family ATP-binding protein [Pseudonocardia broussonetiae]|uniref:MinD/ParA family protein n=1 Tax=Pseudonocardia broussonetiae TaxID=2736640 RepID=A0A6M6JT98_9PSEU|nr:MinD/ParA family protein [Pseudonocardia broussonetiae]QJY49792.1 MinD/ParA family protein [Pseudonocardia broussonetiae]